MERATHKKRIFITGGAGFLGANLCERLLKDGHDVICVDNFSTGTWSNIEHLRDYERFTVFTHDITTPLFVMADEIINLACPASPRHYQADPVHTLETCFLGAMNVLRLASMLRCPVLQASTSEVYGDPQIHPQTESYLGNVNPIGLRACYDEGKRAAESVCFEFHRQYDLAVKVGRIFNTYGPRMQCDDGRVVSNFIVQALHDRPLSIYGEGSQTRSFCYVDDLLDGLLLLLATPADFCGPANIGNPHEITVLELAELILELTGSASRIAFQPAPPDDPARRCPDISRMRERVRWEPKVPLREGLSRTIEYFDRSLATPDTGRPRPVEARDARNSRYCANTRHRTPPAAAPDSSAPGIRRLGRRQVTK